MRLAGAVAALVLAGGATACGGGEERAGDGDQPVRVGGIFDLSGDTADAGTPYADGIKGFVRNWNQAGGEPRIDLISEDYKYDPEVAVSVYLSLKRERVVAVQGWGTSDTEVLGARVAADRIAFMSASYSDTLTNPSRTPFNFVPGTTYADQMRIALRWISERSDGAEVASFHHDSSFGRSPQQAGAQAARQLGLGFASYRMPETATDYAPQLRRARSQGAKFVVIQNTSTDAARLATSIARRHPDMQIVCLNWCVDELFVELAGEAADGTVGVMPFAPAGVKAAGFAAPRAFLAKRGRTLDQEGVHYVQGWYTMALMAEGIELAAGKGDVTGESIRRALEEMGAFDTGGVSAPVDFTAESHAGMKETKLYVVRNEGWSQLTGPKRVP